MPFTYKTIRLDDYFTTKQGIFESVEAVDPPNALSLGLPGGLSLKIDSSFNDLAVLARTGEGQGNKIVNEGRAADGHRNRGVWSTNPDGSIYLKDPIITFKHHDIMNGVENPTDEPQVDVSGAVSIRNPKQGALMGKPGLLKFVVSQDGRLKLRRLFTSQVKIGNSYVKQVGIDTIAGLFNDDLWHTVGFTIQNDSMSIMYDGHTLKSRSFSYHDFYIKRIFDPRKNLYIGTSGSNSENYIGDMDMILYMGGGGAISFFNKLRPSSGNWTSPILDLGDTYVFDSVTNGGYLSGDHSAAIEVRMSDDSDQRHVVRSRVDLSEMFVPPNYYPSRKLYPRDWAEGRYAQFSLSLGQGASNYSPNLSNVEVRFRKRN